MAPSSPGTHRWTGRVLYALQHPAVALAVLVLASGLPRMATLDRFATADEHLWLTRSANFYCALANGDWAHTFQRQHPGVTTTWAGTLGFLSIARDYRIGCQQIDKMQLEQILQDRGFDPLALLQAGRRFMVLANVVALSLGFLYARQQIGPLPATIGFLLIAFDPFHVALSRLLHLDGLLSSLALLAVLSFSSYLHTRRARDLVVSGLAVGLSCLTRSTGILLFSLAALLALLSRWRDRQPTPFAEMVLWGAMAASTFVALWPAMWVDAYRTVVKVLDMASNYADAGHSTPLFFAGTLYADGRLDASASLFYPVAYLWRSTPVTLGGLLAGALALVFRRDLMPRRPTWRTAIQLVLFALLFTGVLYSSAKKFDRYLLPAATSLHLVSAVGWVAMVRWLRERHTGLLWRCAAGSVLCLVVLGQMISAWRTYPYYLSYYNPLMGGSRAAPETMLVGWGEGLDQAARILNQRPDADQLHVISWYAPGCFSYFFQGTGHNIPTGDMRDHDLQEALNADYAVIYYTHQMQRRLPQALLNYLAHQEPEHVVWIDGLEYARIYRMRSDVRTDPGYERADATMVKIHLEGYSTSPQSPVTGEPLVVSLS